MEPEMGGIAMTVEVRKVGAAQQVHTVEGGKAVIAEHGYHVKITIDLDYNRLTPKQIPYAHKRIHDLITSALDTADKLRVNTTALIEIGDLDDVPLFDIDMGDHA